MIARTVFAVALALTLTLLLSVGGLAADRIDDTPEVTDAYNRAHGRE
jgi:hypothetical protein